MVVATAGAIMSTREDEQRTFPEQEEGDYSNTKGTRRKEPVEDDEAVEDIEVQNSCSLPHRSNYLNLPSSSIAVETSEYCDSQTFASARRINNTSPNPNQNDGNEVEEDIQKPNLPPEIIFWNKIDGPDMEKEWKNVKEQFKIYLPKPDDHEMMKRDLILKCIAHMFQCILDIRRPQSCYKVDLKRMIAFFGPFTLERNGCFMNMFDIQKNTTVLARRDGQESVDTYFAGYMSKDEAKKRLFGTIEKEKGFNGHVSSGMFIVRFSETCPDEGAFSLDIRVNEQKVEHYAIERQSVSRKFYIENGILFDTIPELVSHYRSNTLDKDCYITCVNPCPELPFSKICQQYPNLKKKSRPRAKFGGIGRGEHKTVAAGRGR